MADILYLMGFFKTPEIGRISYKPDNLHVTVLQSFNLGNRGLSDFIEEAEQLIEKHTPIEVSPKEQKMYGDEFNIPVLVVEEKTGTLTELHNSLTSLVKKYNGGFNQPVYNGKFYSPHITYATKETEIPTITNLSLIEHINGFGVDVFNIKNFELGAKNGQ